VDEAAGRDGVNLRRLTIDDYQELMALWSRCGLPSLRPEGRDAQGALAGQIASGAVSILALEEDGLAAAVLVSHDARKGWINRLVVAPEHRGRGLGRELLGKAEEDLRQRGIGIFAVLIERDNEASRNLFRREGYVPGDDILYLSKRDDPSV
jgi:ribosomal protein S18 acetylase RimI-like enzyme